MILILSAEDDSHVTVVTRTLEERGVPYAWFDPARFPASAHVEVEYGPKGFTRRLFRDGQDDIDLSAVTAVWDRRPGIPVAAPEVTDPDLRRWITAESSYCLAGLWASLDCSWIPGKPADIMAAQNKVAGLDLAARIGFRIPRTVVTNNPDRFLEFYAECGGHMITKVLRDGLAYREGEAYAAYTHRVRRRDVARYRSARYAPLILQEYVAKRVELRITVIGSRVFAAEINSQASQATKHDWRHYDHDRARYSIHELPRSVERLCCRLLEALRLSFGAIDMVLTPSGEYVFLEINPSGQWAWIEDLTGLPIGAAVADFLVGGPHQHQHEHVTPV